MAATEYIVHKCIQCLLKHVIGIITAFQKKIKEIFKSFSGKTEKDVGYLFRKDIGNYKILGQRMQ